jgi:hypothetical protein
MRAARSSVRPEGRRQKSVGSRGRGQDNLSPRWLMEVTSSRASMLLCNRGDRSVQTPRPHRYGLTAMSWTAAARASNGPGSTRPKVVVQGTRRQRSFDVATIPLRRSRRSGSGFDYAGRSGHRPLRFWPTHRRHRGQASNQLIATALSCRTMTSTGASAMDQLPVTSSTFIASHSSPISDADRSFAMFR